MGLSVVTPPTAWPLTTEEAKAQCRVRHSSEDGYLDDLVRAATVYLEGQLDYTLARRTYRLTLDAFTDNIELPRRPVSSVTEVRYFDEDGDETVLDPATYLVDLQSSVQWIVRNEDTSWPATLPGVNSVMVEFVAGYLPAEVPDDVKHAIRMLVAHWYANREPVVIGSISAKIPYTLEAVIQSIAIPVA